MNDDFELFVMGDGADEFRRCFKDEKLGSNFNQSSEFVYVCGSELWCGEDGKGGFGVEPMLGEECLE